MARRVKTTFGERLRQARRLVDFTQSQLAGEVGVHPITIHRWEQISRLPSADHLYKLAAALGVDADWLALGSVPAKRAAGEV